jgi:hypothetical protein
MEPGIFSYVSSGNMRQEPDTDSDFDGLDEEAEQASRDLMRQVDRARQLLRDYRALIGEHADNDQR